MGEGTNEPTQERITPADIQRQEFGVSRFGGYRMRDVDEFLDRLTESTESLIVENERLRRGAAPIVGTSDLAEIDRQADEILRRARDEAARIVHDADRRHAAASIGPVDDAQRVAVDAFLSQERAFLQSLATLVQGHAESVKAMAKQSRQTSERATGADVDDEPGAEEPERTEADIQIPEAEDEAPDDERAVDEQAPSVERSGDETVVLDVSQPTPTSGREGEGDPSLKQLFWGGGENR